MNGLFPLKFVYQHRPSWVLTIQWERQAFAVAAEAAYGVAMRQTVVLASAWHPPTEAHHQIRHRSPLCGRLLPNYFDYCGGPERLGILQ